MTGIMSLLYLLRISKINNVSFIQLSFFEVGLDENHYAIQFVDIPLLCSAAAAALQRIHHLCTLFIDKLYKTILIV